jgi:hypothetical protein
MLGIRDEEIAMRSAGKPPTRIMPHVLELGLPGDRFRLGKISHRIIAVDGKPWFATPGRRSCQRSTQKPEKRGRRR